MHLLLIAAYADFLCSHPLKQECLTRGTRSEGLSYDRQEKVFVYANLRYFEDNLCKFMLHLYKFTVNIC